MFFSEKFLFIFICVSIFICLNGSLNPQHWISVTSHQKPKSRISTNWPFTQCPRLKYSQTSYLSQQMQVISQLQNCFSLLSHVHCSDPYNKWPLFLFILLQKWIKFHACIPLHIPHLQTISTTYFSPYN